MIKIKDITSELSKLTDKYDEKYIDGLVREQLAILDYKKTFQGELNEQDEEDEIELDPEELPVDKEEPIEKEPESQEEPEIETQPEEEPEPEVQGGEDGEIELEPEELPTPKPLPIVHTPKEDYETISRKQAQELLSYKGKIFAAVFSKREDGSLRAMNGMTGVRKFTVGGELPYSPQEKGLVPVYDLKIGLGRKGYRMLPLEGLKTLNINGKKYKIDQNIKEIKVNRPNKYIIGKEYKVDTINGTKLLKLNSIGKGNHYRFEDGVMRYHLTQDQMDRKNLNENMKKSELRQLVKEAILESRTTSLFEEEEDKSPRKKTSFNFKSTFEDLVIKINTSNPKDFNSLKQEWLTRLESSKINPNTAKKMIGDVKNVPNHLALIRYANNALLKYEKLGLNENQPSPQRVSPDRETITKPETDTPERKPKRRTLTPPTESPNTRPKAESVIKENDKQIANKIADRFKKLK